MAAKHCSHIIADGHVCGSPAMRGTLFCYYHSRDRQRTRILRRRAKKQKSPEADIQIIASLNLPTPDNPVATQVCIAGILQAMMTGVLSGPLGGRLLYGLQMAKSNYREVDQFKKQYLDEDIPLTTVPFALSDPEPIVDLTAAPEEQADEEAELKDYAKSLKIGEYERVTIDDEATKAECAIDSVFEETLCHLDSQPDTSKEHIRKALFSGSRSWRTDQRKYILKSLVNELSNLRDELRKLKASTVPAETGNVSSVRA